MRSEKPFSAGKPTFVIFITLLLASAIVPTPAQARKFKVLHTFHGKDGAFPAGRLIRDAKGDIYGTTEGGGAGKCTKMGCGTVFKLNRTGKQMWLHSFAGSNGMEPAAGLLRDAAGNLFGTTVVGGDISCAPPYGCGTVFKLSSVTGKEAVVHKFTGSPDGWNPTALLVEDAAGNLYGTTYQGGDDAFGAVFKVDAAGKESVLYSFPGGSDGCFPYPGVVLDSDGNLYGVAFDGGVSGSCNNGYGLVFRIDTSGNETVLHTFSGGSDGANPDSVLLFDSKGNLYGTTENGGSGQCGGTGCGTVFELSPQSGGGWAETILYAFCSLSSCADGEAPGGLILDASGDLYGTTYYGGKSGDGTVFELDSSRKETVLYSFTGGSDGSSPNGGLAVDEDGNFYGTAEVGGAVCYTRYTCGVVFKITP
jgi:uncharacterized repeat protein (TIGR03803 family)